MQNVKPQFLENGELKRVIPIDGTLNFRDLGGYKTDQGRTVKWRRVFRSAQLHSLSEEGIRALADLNIKTVVDLRFFEEVDNYPTIIRALPEADFFTWDDEVFDSQAGDKETPNADRMRQSWRDSLDSNDPAVVREAMRSNYPTKLYSHRAIYRRMLLQLIEGETPLLFHCAAGKDRTGVAAALILSLLGVNNQQIIDDYMLTQNLIEGRMEAWLAGGATNQDQYQGFQKKLAEQPSEMLRPVFDADRSYIDTLLEYVAETYENFHTYATKQLQLTEKQISELQTQLLD